MVWKNKYDQEMPQSQTNPWHCEEETEHNIIKAISSLFLIEMMDTKYYITKQGPNTKLSHTMGVTINSESETTRTYKTSKQ